MGLHAYCITYAGHEPRVAGLDGEPVLAVVAGELAAWVSEHPERPRPAIDALRDHDAVVRAAMTPLATPVPLRFGQWLESTEALRARLADRADHWAELLAAFAGAVEMGLRIAEAEPVPLPVFAAPEPRPRSGREYLERLAARAHHEAQGAAREAHALEALHRALGDHVLREAHGDVPDGADFLWVAHLVHLEHASVYREAVASLASSAPAYRVRLTGPWPPYSFVT
jgi:hypothetical protein